MEFYLLDVKSTVSVNGTEMAFDYLNTFFDVKKAVEEAKQLSENDNVVSVSVHKWIMKEDGTMEHATDDDSVLYRYQKGASCDSSERLSKSVTKGCFMRVATTEYAVEIMREANGFPQLVKQLEVFGTYEEAEAFKEEYKEPLRNDEYLNIIYIDYDEFGDEIGFGSVL